MKKTILFTSIFVVASFIKIASLTAQFQRIGLVYQSANIGMGSTNNGIGIEDFNSRMNSFGLSAEYHLFDKLNLQFNLFYNPESFTNLSDGQVTAVSSTINQDIFIRTIIVDPGKSRQVRLGLLLNYDLFSLSRITFRPIAGFELLFDNLGNYSVEFASSEANTMDYRYQNVNPLLTTGAETVINLTSWLDFSVMISYSHALNGAFGKRVTNLFDEGSLTDTIIDNRRYLHSLNTVFGFKYKF